MSNTTKNLSSLLNNPFPYEGYGVNYEGQSYVSIQWIVDRLNDVVGPLNWRHEFFDVNENLTDNSVELLGRLSIWDEEKKTWTERTNYGNDTMTILKGATAPTAQDRMDCKKSAISDSLKKCAAWFGVAADVFKNSVDVIKPTKYDGKPNPLYSRLVASFAFVNQYGQHKYGIPILPDAYRLHYEENGWLGIFKSDVDGIFLNCSNGSTTGNPASNEQPSSRSILPDDNGSSDGNKGTSNAGGSTNGSTSRSGSTGRGNSSNGGSTTAPTLLRMKVQDAPKFNQDGSATFKAMLESQAVVTVFADKKLADEVRKIKPDLVIKTNGWYREDQQKVTLATKNGKIDVEAA